jgi:transcriptional regulator with XRE-family HTH domain
MEQKTVGIIEVIDKERQKCGLNSAEFSRKIGVKEELWSRFRRGLRPPTDGFLVKVLKKFRELRRPILKYWLEPEE